MRNTSIRRLLAAAAALLAIAILAALPGDRADASPSDTGVIYFSTWDYGDRAFYRMNPDGSGKTALPDNVWGESSVLLHDGRWFLRADETGDTYPDGRARLEIFAVHESGSPVVQLTDGKIDASTYIEPNTLYYYNVREIPFRVQPRWADGDRQVSCLGIAASYDAQGTRTVSDGGIYVLAVNPGDLASHTPTAMSGSPLVSFPLLTSSTVNSLVYIGGSYDFSPDAGSLVHGPANLTTPGMYLADASDGFSTSTLLTTSGWSDLRWSPTGDRILFEGGGDIRSIETDGTDERMLVEDPPDGLGKKGWQKTSSVMLPFWSPNATHIVYEFYYRDSSKTPVLHDADLVRATAAGGEPSTLTGDLNLAVCAFPQWRGMEEATGPAVEITFPTGGSAVSGSVTIAVAASGDDPIQKVDFRVDGDIVATDEASPYEISWDSTAVSDGEVTISATATDADGETGTDSVSVTVDNVDDPPSVTITAPPAGSTVSGTVTIAALAGDDRAVAQVRFFVDAILIGTDTTSPYQVAWNTTTVVDGSHALTAIATDGAGKTASDGISVSVMNAAPSLTVTSIAPNTMKAGSSIGVTVGGTGFVTGATLKFVGGTDGIPTASSVVVLSPTAITATIHVSASGGKGTRTWNVVVTNPDGTSAAMAGGFNVIK